MFNTTTLGQLATEYLDDRRQEFKTLEAKVKIDMKIRNDDLQEMRMQVEKIDKQIKRLIRRDVYNTKPYIFKAPIDIKLFVERHHLEYKPQSFCEHSLRRELGNRKPTEGVTKHYQLFDRDNSCFKLQGHLSMVILYIYLLIL